MTLEQLRARTCKELGLIAKRHSLAGWHDMNKEDLVKSLRAYYQRQRKAELDRKRRKAPVPTSVARRTPKNVEPNGHNGKAHHNGKPTRPSKSGKLASKTVAHAYQRPAICLGETEASDNAAQSFGLFAEACEPYWVHARWYLTREMLERAATALGVDWHSAVPVLRVFDLTPNDMTTAAEEFVQDIEIGGMVDHWYVHVPDAQRIYKLHIGFRTPAGRFFTVARSNRIRPTRTENPRPRAYVNGKNNNGHGANGETYHSLFVHEDFDDAPKRRNNGDDEDTPAIKRERFPFQLEAELIVHGSTHPDAEFHLCGERVRLRTDGSFSMRVALPEGRHVIPAEAITPSRSERHMIVLSIERNTKELEPQSVDEPFA